MGIIGIIVATVLGVFLAFGASTAVINTIDTTPSGPINQPLIDYYGQR